MSFAISPYPDVNAVITHYHQHIRHILGETFVGMYLYGSLTTGYFDWESSDIDYLVVTTEAVAGLTLEALQRMHVDLSKLSDRWGLEIEASYIPIDAIWKHDINNRHHPHIDRGDNRLCVMQHDMDWIVQRYMLLKSGIVLDGVPLVDLIAPIAVDTLRQTMIDMMDFWWLPASHDPNFFDGEGAGYSRYAILSMCRMLYTCETGDTIAKVPAGEWALGVLDAQWHHLVQLALDYPNGSPLMTQDDVQQFIRYVDKLMRITLSQ